MATTFISYGPTVKRELKKVVRARMMAAARAYEKELRRLMEEPKSGVIDTRKGSSHQASAPGEAPAIDTGAMSKGIIHGMASKGEMGWGVGIGMRTVALTEQARALELGTWKMAPRSMWKPAMITLRARMKAILSAKGKLSELSEKEE